MDKLCIFPLFSSVFSLLFCILVFSLGVTKKYSQYHLLWKLNGYDSAWKTPCLLNMLFKRYCGSYFGWNLSIRKTKIWLGKWQEIKSCLLCLLFAVLSLCKVYWKIFVLCGLCGNVVYKWAYAANMHIIRYIRVCFAYRSFSREPYTLMCSL